MTTYAIEYSNAVAEYPEVIKDMERERKSPLTDYKWTIETAERIQSIDLVGLLQGRPIPEEPIQDIEQIVANRVKATTAYLKAVKGRKKVVSSSLPKVPTEIVNSYRAAAEESKAEKARVASLTPEQRKEEMVQAVKELSKYPGFTVLSI